MNIHDFAWLVIRVALAAVYLYAAYRNTKDQIARKWTLNHTALLFDLYPQVIPLDLRDGVVSNKIKFFAWSGMAIMYIGSTSILLGLEGRLGGALLAVFTAVGIYQHKREAARALVVADAVTGGQPAGPRGIAEELRWSAFAGHFSSGLKNYSLVGLCLWFVLQGTGSFSVSDRCGEWLRLYFK